MFPHVQETLATLRGRAVLMGIVTSSSGRIVEPLLSKLDLSEYFRVVIHAGNCIWRKPQPGSLLQALDTLGILPSKDVFYVGDRSVDAEAALAAGVEFAWASSGYGGARTRCSTIALKTFVDILYL